MKLNLGGARGHETGYGRMSVELGAALVNLGVQIDDYVPSDVMADGNPRWGTTARPIHRNGLWATSPTHVKGWWKGQRVHVLTMWEATEVPPAFRDTVHDIETLIVPSEQNRGLFSRFHDNVRKIPLGVNQEQWHYRERPPVERDFRFLTAGSGERKGVDVAVEAFKRVFGTYVPSSNDPIPTLTVKNRVSVDGIHGDRIHQLSGTISLADEIELYAQAHCFLGLARGEGWGMMPFQAIAQGCPTIISDAHGHHEFAHLAAIPVGTSLIPAETFIFGDGGEWWDPDLEEVCESMWEMYVNYEDYLPIAKHGSEVIRDEYTWEHSARKVIDIIGETSLDSPDLVSPGWYEPITQVFHIVPSKDCTYEVNGATYTFKKGEDYWEMADLKRMMYDHDALDWECLTDPHESGLLPNQVSEIDRYKARHARCETCGQMLNSDVSLDFDDEDAMGLAP